MNKTMLVFIKTQVHKMYMLIKGKFIKPPKTSYQMFTAWLLGLNSHSSEVYSVDHYIIVFQNHPFSHMYFFLR